MSHFKLLDADAICQENKSEIFKKNGTGAAITDFANLIGGYASKDIAIFDRLSKKLMAAPWWIETKKSEDPSEKIYATCINNKFDYAPESSKQIGIRPSIHYNQIITNPIVDHEIKKSPIKEIKYGEYPQWITDKKTQNILEHLYNLGILIKTGKKYLNETYTEYQYNGTRYIRFEEKSESGKILSNKEATQKGEKYWIKVQPIEWYVSEKENSMISKYILAAGINYNNIQIFLDNSFSKEIKRQENMQPFQERNEYIQQLIAAKQALESIKNICENSNVSENEKQYILKVINQTGKN